MSNLHFSTYISMKTAHKTINGYYWLSRIDNLLFGQIYVGKTLLFGTGITSCMIANAV